MFKSLESALNNAKVLLRALKNLVIPNSLENDFSTLNALFYKDYWHQIALKNHLKIEPFNYGYYRLSRGKKSTFVQEKNLMLNNVLTHDIYANKILAYQLLQNHGFGQYLLEYQVFRRHEVNKAYAFLQRVSRPLVIKPAAHMGGGIGITVDVTHLKQLKKAIKIAGSYREELLAEPFCAGISYRLLYYRGHLLDVLQRLPPILVGDGQHTIKTLIQLENSARLSGPIKSLCELRLDLDCQLALARQKLQANSIPAKNQVFEVKNAVNENSADQNRSMINDIHKEISQLGSDMVNKLDIEFAGIDLITQDITKPLNEAKVIINEINTRPGLHFHQLIENPEHAIDVGSLIIDDLLS